LEIAFLSSWLPWLVLVPVLFVLPILSLPALVAGGVMGLVWWHFRRRGGIRSRLLIVTDRRVILKDREHRYHAPLEQVKFVHAHDRSWSLKGLPSWEPRRVPWARAVIGETQLLLEDPGMDSKLEGCIARVMDGAGYGEDE